MKYVDEYRSKKIVKTLVDEICREADAGGRYNIMEVCGTHTMSISRFGLADMLPDNVNLISGPGCPVCVTPNEFLDKAICLANREEIIIATFGDLLRVPGSRSSLEKERAKGRHIKTVYSTIDALKLAEKNPDKEIVFLGIGFETTAPTVAQSILIAKKEGIRNYSVLCGHKTMPEVLRALVEDKSVAIDGFLLPGHVSAIIGVKPYGFLASEFGKRCVISGFEPADILESVLKVIRQKAPKVEIEYTRIANPEGNRLALQAMAKVFRPLSSIWRGIGTVKDSGLKIRNEFCSFDADIKFKPKIAKPKENKACVCGDVLKGVKTPLECRLFGKVCNPEKPVGACMVSSEGTCAAYFKYGRTGRSAINHKV